MSVEVKVRGLCRWSDSQEPGCFRKNRKFIQEITVHGSEVLLVTVRYWMSGWCCTFGLDRFAVDQPVLKQAWPKGAGRNRSDRGGGC